MAANSSRSTLSTPRNRSAPGRGMAEFRLRSGSPIYTVAGLKAKGATAAAMRPALTPFPAIQAGELKKCRVVAGGPIAAGHPPRPWLRRPRRNHTCLVLLGCRQFFPSIGFHERPDVVTGAGGRQRTAVVRADGVGRERRFAAGGEADAFQAGVSASFAERDSGPDALRRPPDPHSNRWGLSLWRSNP